jgi:HlyD family secretion protein
MFPKGKQWKKLWIALLVVLVLAAGGGGYLYYTRNRAAAQTATQSTLQTARVRRGDLTLSATAAGTVIPTSEVSLGFQSTGTLLTVTVKVGDHVVAGEVLARVDDQSAQQGLAIAEAQVTKAELALTTARQSHEELLKGASTADVLAAKAALATAQQELEALTKSATAAELASAEAAVTSAQAAYTQLVNGPTANAITKAEMNVSKAKNSLWSSQLSRDSVVGNPNSNQTQKDAARAGVLNAELSVQEAEMDLATLQEPATAAELKAAYATLLTAQEKLANLKAGPTAAETATAQAKVAQAQAALDELQAKPTKTDVATSEGTVQQAELTLSQAKMDLVSAQEVVSATTIIAPMGGTVTSVSAQAGENVAQNSTIIVLADLSHPLLEIFVDETDMDQIAVGYEVEVVFDALPDETFKGHVVQIDPALVSKANVSVIRAIVSLDSGSYSKPQELSSGLSATVDVIGGRATNAILVPVEALREIDKGQYAVFVVENGEPKLVMVEVGLMDSTYAECKSGLQGNETVSTGQMEVSQ